MSWEDVEEGRGVDYPCLPPSSLLSPSLIPFFSSSFFHYHRRVQLARKVSLEKTPESDTKTNLESREGATSTKSPNDQATLALTQSISKSVLVHSFSHLLPFSPSPVFSLPLSQPMQFYLLGISPPLPSLYRSLLTNVGENDSKQFKLMFDSIDKNQDGQLSLKELEEFALELG